MEKLELKHETAHKTIESLNKLFNFIEKEKNIKFLDFINSDKQEEELKILRDSLIQRFKYSVDTLWKYLKLYFLIKKGIERIYPKAIFRECFSASFVDTQECEELIQMVDDRNLTSHAYKEILANSVIRKIYDYYKLMEKIMTQTKP